MFSFFPLTQIPYFRSERISARRFPLNFSHYKLKVSQLGFRAVDNVFCRTLRYALKFSGKTCNHLK